MIGIDVEEIRRRLKPILEKNKTEKSRREAIRWFTTAEDDLDTA